MTHKELVDYGAEWLTKSAPNTYLRCSYAVKELKTLSVEEPDIFGFRSGKTVLIEVKVSRADFLAESKKICRHKFFDGIGMNRYYLCPEGLIQWDEVGNWGLLWYSGEGIRIVKKSEWFEGERRNDIAVMYSIIRRLTDKYGVLEF